MRVALVTNLCTHYRRPLFEELGRRFDVDFFFTSTGSEWYWPSGVPVPVGGLPGKTGSGRDLVPALVRGEYDCVVASLAGRIALPAAFLTAAARRLPLVLWVGVWAHPKTPFHRLTRPLTRELYRRADALLVYGPHVAAFVAAESGRTADVFVAPQAVDGEIFSRPRAAAELTAVRRRFGLGDGPVAAFVGRLEPEKGLDVLLRAFRRTTAPTLLLAGDGSLAPALRALARELRVADRVRFAGRVGQHELPALLQASDLLVLPSITTPRWKEPWGLVVNEAMSCGLPVVATDAVGAAAGGLAVDGRTGLVVPERNEAALAAALERLGADDALRARLGAAAREHVRRFNFEAAADAFERAIEAAIASRARSRGEVACAS